MKPVFFLFIFLWLSLSSLWAQGEICANIEPFCAGGEEFVFANTYNQSGQPIEAETGPFYGELTTQRNPSWYYLQVQESGKLEFLISQTQNADGSGAILDVDFAVWGPFSPTDDICDYNMLSEGNLVESSYSPDSTERMDLGEANVGEIYVVLITNHSNYKGYIKLEQTNAGQPGAGSTDCFQGGIEDVINSCEGESVTVDGTILFAEEYTWFVEVNGIFEEIAGEKDAFLEVKEEGNYKLEATDRFGEEITEPFSVYFNPIPIANAPTELYICDAGLEVIDLTQLNAEIIAGNANPGNLEVNFYNSEEDFENENPIPDPENFTNVETQEIYAGIKANGDCYSNLVKVDIRVEIISEEIIKETIILCADTQGNLTQEISLGEDLGVNYKYEWIFGGNPVSNQAIFILDEVPSSNELRLEITDTRGNCVKIFESEIQVFSAPDKVDIEIDGNDFEEGFTITATGNSLMFPNSDYEYQLDNGPWQESNIFRKVHPGLHNITAREINGCGSTTSENFNLVGYPRFFTPNSDGYNDTWKIEGDEDIKVLKLSIYDRFGKLLKQLNPGGSGWDGTFGGRELPADDYWFNLEYQDRNTGKTSIFKSHFSLKR